MRHSIVLLVTLASLAARSEACPTDCRCRNYPVGPADEDYYVALWCRELPDNVADKTRIRELSLATLGASEDVTRLLPALERLSLSRALLINVSLTAFSGLRHLDISHNNLTDLWDKSANFSRLMGLDVSGNKLQLSGNEFRTMFELRSLNLSNNELVDIPKDIFVGLKNLQFLDLSGNQLKTLVDYIFQPLPALLHLNLSNNRLEKLRDLAFVKLNRLQQLDLSYNLLVNVTALQLPNLTRLLLTGNNRLGVTDETVLVGTGPRLRIVEASFLGLRQVPSSLTQSIRTLRLSSNVIRGVDCGNVDSYPLLQLLDLTSNAIEYVEEDALGRLDELTILYLGNNRLITIPKKLPDQLKVLHLENNAITTIGDDLVAPRLEVLLISDNNISVIQNEAFTHLGSLVTLDLSSNPIKSLSPGQLNPVRLQVLKMASIDLIAPAKDLSFPLSNPEHLIKLNLSNSPGLARQFLDDAAALAAAKELQELDVTSTDLHGLRSDLFHYLPQLKTLHLEGNKLNCTYLNWLASWMRQQNDVSYQKIICSSPPEFWGTPLVDLQTNEIDTTIPTINLKPFKKFVKFKSSYTIDKREKTSLYVDVIPDSPKATGNELSLPMRDEPKQIANPGVYIFGFGFFAVIVVIVAYAIKLRPRDRDHDRDAGSLESHIELW